MLGLIDRSPDIYLDELQEELEAQHNVYISLATIWRTLKRLGMTSKRVCILIHHSAFYSRLHQEQLSKAARERCADSRRRFALEIGKEPPDCLVFADESAVNLFMTYRENGWAVQGVRAIKYCHFVRGTRYVSQVTVLTSSQHIFCPQLFCFACSIARRNHLQPCEGWEL